MIEVESESISKFGLLAGSQVQPEEQIFVLSSCQLQDVILQVTAPLLKRLDTLEVELQKHIKNDELELENTATNITILWKAMFGSKAPGKTFQERAERLDRYMEARQDHKASFEQIRGFLEITARKLNPTIRCLMDAHPAKYSIRADQRDTRKNWLYINPKI